MFLYYVPGRHKNWQKKKKKKKTAQGVFYVVIQKLMNQKFFLRKQ